MPPILKLYGPQSQVGPKLEPIGPSWAEVGALLAEVGPKSGQCCGLQNVSKFVNDHSRELLFGGES